METATKEDYLSPPPPYRDTRLATSTTSKPIMKTTPFRFPQQFGVYHASGSYSDLWIASSAESPPLFYISTHSGLSSHPSVVLHSNGHPSSAPIANAQLSSFSSTIDIALPNQNYSLVRSGAFSTGKFFDFPIIATGKIERFEWRSSSGPEVAALQGRTRGMKLVRISTGEAVAVWARPNLGTKKKGKLRFMARHKGEMDARWEDMVVISILAIVEKARRTNNNGSAAAGISAGAAAGGGGC